MPYPPAMYTIIGGDGKEYGPVPVDQVRAWVAGGRASLDTQAKALGTNEWKRLGDFPDFSARASDFPPRIGEDAPNPGVPGGVLAGRWIRLGARLLDAVLGGILLAPGLILMSPWLIAHHGDDSILAAMRANPPPYLSVFAVGCFVLVAVQAFLLSTRGQTVGKIIVGVRIVRLDGRPAGFVHALLLRSLVIGVIENIPWLGLGFDLADILFIFTAERRCLHDLIAGTRVVTVEPRSTG
jgi:uncharacterized RDD family membrane protein YckC